MSLNYDSDDALPKSPGLAPVRPRATPSPSPPPRITRQVILSSTAQNVSSPSSRRHKKSNRRKTRPSQGDAVLIRNMDPNRPDIAREAGERALNSESGSEAEDEEMDERSPTAEAAPPDAASTQSSSTDAPSVDHVKIAQKALNAETTINSATQPVPTKPLPPPFNSHRDSVVEIDGQDRNALNDSATSQSSSSTAAANGGLSGSSGADAKSPSNSSSTTQATSPVLSAASRGSISNGRPHVNSSGSAPNLPGLTIPTSQRLPALQPQSPPQDGSATSPSQQQKLPSFRHLSDLAETAIQEQESNRTNSFPHRQSISSTGQSPTPGVRQLSITSLSPGSAYPLSAASSGSSDFQTRDPFLRSSGLTLFNSPRRPSQASDIGPYSATLASATTNDSYQSSDGLSPSAPPGPLDVRGQRMSIDGALTSRTLPPPVGPNIQHIPPHNSGGFKCEHPGCNAAPFQTQYLLK